MTAYVYDPQTLRLVASFDDQHFGLYYQYNQEGKLVRKLVETEKGMKTITETQYHSPQVAPTLGLE
jgi:YD repeat-containing protein